MTFACKGVAPVPPAVFRRCARVAWCQWKTGNEAGVAAFPVRPCRTGGLLPATLGWGAGRVNCLKRQVVQYAPPGGWGATPVRNLWRREGGALCWPRAPVPRDCPEDTSDRPAPTPEPAARN